MDGKVFFRDIVTPPHFHNLFSTFKDSHRLRNSIFTPMKKQQGMRHNKAATFLK